MKPVSISIKAFQDTVWEFYKNNRRDMPWRVPEADGSYNAYKIMVSEMMLQQTQVGRVLPKYKEFLRLFPSVKELATAELSEVLQAWSGLGYNRRAKFLWLAARQIEEKFKGLIPDSPEELKKLPGIGQNTAAAILAYAYDRPVVFVETNIRTVFIHHFFNDRNDILDTEICALVRDALPSKNYREWYYALMDYGTYLKSTVGNKTRQSKSFIHQSTFKGSLRQVRGAVLRALANGPLGREELHIAVNDDRLLVVCKQLEVENLIHQQIGRYFLG
jgi:A/G-specific adenine glycosylase